MQTETPIAKLLMVDDDRIIRETLHELLSVTYECHTADRAEQALECLEFQNYDAVITDISMPSVSGFQIFKRILARHSAIPIIVISGNCDQFRDLFLAMGAFAYFTKPFHLDELELAISQAVARHEHLSTMVA